MVPVLLVWRLPRKNPRAASAEAAAWGSANPALGGESQRRAAPGLACPPPRGQDPGCGAAAPPGPGGQQSLGLSAEGATAAAPSCSAHAGWGLFVPICPTRLTPPRPVPSGCHGAGLGGNPAMPPWPPPCTAPSRTRPGWLPLSSGGFWAAPGGFCPLPAWPGGRGWCRRATR